ncbi:hypothetical protein FQA47_012212 [Oryzias melastigma]|uniref:Uncharacterized protein n=1 Tax=Oryzias melastigma TaxID=30732 RepID=A0A834KXZ2_ORYME|nr:hypothetical protein FQA47_012212 [Oryzias melastigma]
MLMKLKKRHNEDPFFFYRSASNIDCVYSTVELPKKIQTSSAEKSKTKQQPHMDDDSLNYASLHFKNKPKCPKPRIPEEDVVYAKVCKAKPPSEVRNNSNILFSTLFPALSYKRDKEYLRNHLN